MLWCVRGLLVGWHEFRSEWPSIIFIKLSFLIWGSGCLRLVSPSDASPVPAPPSPHAVLFPPPPPPMLTACAHQQKQAAGAYSVVCSPGPLPLPLPPTLYVCLHHGPRLLGHLFTIPISCSMSACATRMLNLLAKVQHTLQT